MAKFSVCVTEEVTVNYPAIEIEAATEADAKAIAEEMRVQGGLGDPACYASVDDVFYDVALAA